MREEGQKGAGRLHFKGKGLSLDAFAKAKSSTYDPRIVKEQERLRASRTVSKYKKLKKRMEKGAPSVKGESLDNREKEAPKHEAQRSSKEEREDRQGNVSSNVTNKKRPAAEAAVPEGHSAQPSSEDLARRQEAMMRRRTEHKLFKKKTSHGQPVMKYRIEKLLHKLASD